MHCQMSFKSTDDNSPSKGKPYRKVEIRARQGQQCLISTIELENFNADIDNLSILQVYFHWGKNSYWALSERSSRTETESGTVTCRTATESRTITAV